MNQATVNQLSEQPRIFRIPLVYRLIMAVFTGVAMGALGSLVLVWLTRDLGRGLVATLLFSGTIAALNFWYNSSYSLRVSSEVIEYRVPTHCVRANWAEVEEVAIVGGWARPVKGLHVRTNTKPVSLIGLLFMFPSSDIRNSIPLRIFTPFSWESSEVVTEIRKYRPDLFGAQQQL